MKRKRRKVMQNIPKVNDVIIYTEKRPGGSQEERELFVRSVDNGKIFGYDAEGKQHFLSMTNLNMRVTGNHFDTIEAYENSRKASQDYSLEDILSLPGFAPSPGRSGKQRECDVAITAINQAKSTNRLAATIYNSMDGYFKKGNQYELKPTPGMERLYFVPNDKGKGYTTTPQGNNAIRIQFIDRRFAGDFWKYVDSMAEKRIYRNWKYDSKCKLYYITIKEA